MQSTTVRPPVRFPFLAVGFICLAVSAALAQTPSGPERWEKDIQAFEAADRTNPPPQNAVLFIGSSSIRLWKTLAQDFPKYPVINRGFGGSEIGDSVHFVPRIVLPYNPRLIVMYAGGNDLNNGKAPEEVFANFKAFVESVRAHLPQTRIAYISSAPNPARWAQVEKVRALNRQIEQFTRGDRRLAFVDMFSRMLGPDGLPRPEIFSEDNLHMNEKGYALWRSVVGPYLEPDRD